MGKFKDLTGRSFGRLTVVQLGSPVRNRPAWVCNCTCGKVILVRANALNKSKPVVKSCGCLRKDNARQSGSVTRKDPHELVVNMLFNGYKSRSRRKKIPWTMTLPEFKSLIFGDCYYCGEPAKHGNVARHRRCDYQFNYNGIDRQDSLSGYSIDNCVTCCSQCNYSKLDYSSVEFYDWIKRVYTHCIQEGRI